MSRIKYLYAITGIRAFSSKKWSPRINSHCEGIELNLFDAKEVLKKCPEVIHDCNNNYAVIEKINVGVWATVFKEWWFCWDKAKEVWIPCDKPEFSEGTCNWAF